MGLTNVLVAVDDSAAGRNAARFAAYLTGFLGGELTVLNVLPAGPPAEPASSETTGGIHAMLGEKIFAAHPALAVEVAAVTGVPQIEIPRYAERIKADLIVLGRKPRSRAARLILGDTADAVVRRSRLPCLLVPAGLTSIRRILVALDGSDRGLAVLRLAMELATSASLDFSAVMVEPGEGPFVSARAERLATRIEGKLESRPGATALATSALQVRHGEVVEQVLAAAVEQKSDILVTGFHPGGPLLVVEEGSVSRQLVHAAPCAVLTIPL